MQVCFCGEPVEDRVLQRSRDVQVLGSRGIILLPPPHDSGHAALVHWRGVTVVDVEDPDGETHRLIPGRDLCLSQGNLDIHFQLVPQFRLARPPLLGEGDLGLAVAVLAMTVLALQLNALTALLGDGGAAGPVMPEPSPELIARLLQEDLDGADEGYLTDPVVREQLEKQVESFYMPAGNKGPLDNAGGAANVAPEPVRSTNTEQPEAPSFQPLPPEELRPELLSTPEEVAAAPVPGVTDPQNLVADLDAQQDEEPDEPVAAEEEEGWGLYAWYDAEDARRDAVEIRQEILRARQRLAIDPDDPWALQQLGYYQYLAEEHEACRRTYERFIELNPEEPAGYNNLALVYKRTGDYSREEGYYRLALSMDPDDDHALNNLAVNLAHQERYTEALEIMKRLETLIPGDPYADLHRAKVYAAMGDEARALEYLEAALEGMARLDTLHHIEFRQDIRVDPAFLTLRTREAFDGLLLQYYGDDAAPLLGGRSG